MDSDDINVIPLISSEVSLRKQKGRGFLIGRGIVFLLNPSAVAILESCDGRRSIREILENLKGHFAVKEGDDIQSQVVNFIKGLAETHVISINGGEKDLNVSCS